METTIIKYIVEKKRKFEMRQLSRKFLHMYGIVEMRIEKMIQVRQTIRIYLLFPMCRLQCINCRIYIVDHR